MQQTLYEIGQIALVSIGGAVVVGTPTLLIGFSFAKLLFGMTKGLDE